MNAALPAVLKGLKSAAIFASATYLLVRFPRLWPTLGLETIEQFGKKIARRKSLSVVIVGASLFVIRGAAALLLGVPLPRYHDEFSYLLAADTFAHGRLTNPPHPMWIHFETFHVIWRPTYMSMYPPGEGLILALGQIIGNPWIGQLIASALMCAAICWMLQGWIPPQWALLGGALAVARLGLLSYFTNGYWSACLPALGGALVLGALPRIQHGARKVHSVVMAFGLFVLANTRPYEGLLLSAGVAIALFAWMISRKGPSARVSWTRIILPIVLTLVPLAAWTGYYYYRVTGSPFRMAYSLNRETYAMGRYFVWQKPWPQKTFHHAKMQASYERELDEANENQTLAGFIHRVRVKFYYLWITYLVAPLPFFLIALPFAVRDRRLRVPWMVAGIFTVGLTVEVWGLPHYFAPVAALLYLFLMQCARHLRHWKWKGRPLGMAMVRAISLVYIATALLRIGLALTHIHPEKEWQHGDMERAAVVRQLDSLPGQHVVLVSYPPDFDLDREWVFNGADIDAQKVVWARDMGAANNHELVEYYKGRQFWQVVGGSTKLQHYSGE